MRFFLLGVALLLPGCSVTGVAAAAIILDNEREAARQGGDGLAGRRDPEMAADRKVSEQDCTKPIDYTLGNIRCK